MWPKARRSSRISPTWPFFEKTLAAPATLSPDTQSKAAKKPTLQGVSGKDIITDGKQTVEVYATTGDTHTNEYTLIYLPGPRILIEGDAYSPGPPDAPVPATPPPNAVALYDELQKSEVERRHDRADPWPRRRADCGVEKIHQREVAARSEGVDPQLPTSNSQRTKLFGSWALGVET